MLSWLINLLDSEEDNLLILAMRIAHYKEKLEEIAAAIKLVMEEKQLFRNPDLSINLLADTLAVKPYLISKSLNEIFDNFVR